MSILYLSSKSDGKYCQNQKLRSETLETKLAWLSVFSWSLKLKKNCQIGICFWISTYCMGPKWSSQDNSHLRKFIYIVVCKDPSNILASLILWYTCSASPHHAASSAHRTVVKRSVPIQRSRLEYTGVCTYCEYIGCF